MTMFGKFKYACALLIAPLVVPSAASAATIIGGGTSVTVTSAPALTGLGLSFSPFGTASAATVGGVPVATFLITGGVFDPVTGNSIVRHDGSGLLFTAGANRLSVGNFIIDTAARTVSATAIANGTTVGTVPLFTIGTGTSLILTSQAAGAFTSVFGAPNLTGTTFGTADINAVVAPTAGAVPEPATWGMMILGFGVIGAVSRNQRRRRSVAFA